MTSPRKTSYLFDTLSRLDMAGASEFDRRLVLSDGSLPEQSETEVRAIYTKSGLGWPTEVYPGPSGTRIAFWRAFKIAYERGFDRVLIVEDDITPCKNALRYINSFSVPDDLAFVSFFEMKELNSTDQYGLHDLGLFQFPRMKTRMYCGNQCMLIPRRTLEYLVACDPSDPELPADRWIVPASSSDCVMGWHLSRSPWPRYGGLMPNLVQHIGEVSSLPEYSTLEGRLSACFPGEDFDAMTLPQNPTRYILTF